MTDEAPAGSTEPRHRTVRPVHANPAQAAASAAAATNQDAIDARIRQANAANGSAGAPDAAAPISETIQIILRDKRMLTVGPPPFYTGFRIAKILNSAKDDDEMTKMAAAMIQQGALKALLYVRAINGVEVPPVDDMVHAIQLANIIGDIGMEQLNFEINAQFSGVSAERLAELKKNLPGS